MKPHKLYDIFLETLADDSVKETITELIASKTDDKIEGQTELFPRSDAIELSAENAELTRKIALLELENGSLRNENENLLSQLRRAKENLNYYCGIYGAQISLYEKCKGLSEDTAAAVKGFFKNQSPSGFFMCGIRLDNLKGLRDYTEHLIIEYGDGKKDDVSILNELYMYLLSCYNATFSEPVYKLMEVSAGGVYDEQLHRNTGTAKSGRISKVYLKGCVAAANGKVIRKSLVKI